jgi:hypothetical protein
VGGASLCTTSQAPALQLPLHPQVHHRQTFLPCRGTWNLCHRRTKNLRCSPLLTSSDREICRTSIYEKHSLSMDASSTMRPGRPPSIQELVSQAENFAFNVNIPLRHWIRTAETLCQEVSFPIVRLSVALTELTLMNRPRLPCPTAITAEPT